MPAEEVLLCSFEGGNVVLNGGYLATDQADEARFDEALHAVHAVYPLPRRGEPDPYSAQRLARRQPLEGEARRSWERIFDGAALALNTWHAGPDQRVQACFEVLRLADAKSSKAFVGKQKR